MNSKKIEKCLDEYMESWPFSGVIYVSEKDNVIFQQAYGKACYEFNISNTIDTSFSLASVSKQFTSFSIMQLFEKKMIDINVPVNNYLPADLKIDHRITAHHLMSHTSGLHNFYTLKDDFLQEYDRTNYSKQDFYEKYINRPLDFEPGSKYEYSNAGYNVLAWIVEEVSGKKFSDYLRDHIFLPLEMRNTVLDEDLTIIKNKAYSYTMNRDDVVKSLYYNEKYSMGAGGLVSNCNDLHKWYKCLKNRKLLSKDTYKKFFSENLNGYCYGLSRDTVNNRTRYFHGGDHLGKLSYVQYFFEDDVCIIVLSNNDFNNQYKLGGLISDVLFSRNPEIPQRAPEVTLDTESAHKYEGVYLENKIELRNQCGTWELVRYNGNLHITVYPIGNHQFACKWKDRFTPYTLTECEDGMFKFLGFKKKEE